MAEVRNHDNLELEERKQLIKSPSADAFMSNPSNPTNQDELIVQRVTPKYQPSGKKVSDFLEAISQM